MNKLIPMKYSVALLPALAMGLSMASAEDVKCDCPCDHERANVSAEKNHGKRGHEMAAMASERASSTAKARASEKAVVSETHYLGSKSPEDFFASNIIGHEVMNRRDNTIVGSVNELLINRNGQIGAVIVSTGGILGLGKKDLAIAWDQIERKIDGENITLSVDFSDASLVAAPKFARQ